MFGSLLSFSKPSILPSLRNPSQFLVNLALASNQFYDPFSVSKTVEETESMSEGLDPNWWVNSGAYFYTSAGRAYTPQGDLAISSYWQEEYATSNPKDTDGGYHPQNIFRLVTRTKWQNFTQHAYFKVIKDNLSSSPNRNQSNGLLLFNRYQDGDNLYYAGVRVDGALVIKKKLRGTYYTLAYKKYFPGTYNRTTSPNLLPKNQWIGIKTEVTTTTDANQNIRLYLNIGWTGRWTLVLETNDDGRTYGSAIANSGYGGIRTDFMDVEFDSYQITEL